MPSLRTTNLTPALGAVLGREPRVLSLFSRFVEGRRGVLLDLAGVARGLEGDSWEVRRLAALLLQCRAFRLPARRWRELDELLVELGLKAAAGSKVPLDADVLKDGYSTTELPGFLEELRRRLGKAERIFRGLRGRRTSRAAWEDVLAYARQDCKLVLGRYLFTPGEVVDRVRGQVRTSRGQPDSFPSGDLPLHEEMERLRAGLPRFEAEILARLLAGSRIYWVAEETSSELNTLVEYPATTVVLVVKPPGSCQEIEIKRAGCRRSRPLGVVFRRGGEKVPISHRLDGGSMARSLHWDASASARLARIYRAVHGEEAPLSRTVAVNTIYKVPAGEDEVSILDYFTEPGCFGEGFAAMREAMEEATAALSRERDWQLPDLPGPLGLTVRFLNYMAPAQAVLARTSSFRLDRVALYLSAQGPGTKRLADEVLDEALGVYTPPAAAYRDHEGYVAAALAELANRARADGTFRALATEIGRVWGTLLGVRGYTRGESFVERNVGLRSRWSGGDWCVEILFMDHDDLQISSKAFQPRHALPQMVLDERYIQRAMACLEKIYRVSAETGLQGWEALRGEAARAYHATRDAVRSRAEVRELFSPVFVERLEDWDAVVRLFLAASESPEWRGPVRDFLAARGYDEDSVQEHLEALERFAAFHRTTSFLYA